MNNNKTQKLTELNENQCELVFGGYSFGLTDQSTEKNYSKKIYEMTITPTKPKPKLSA